MTGLFITIEGIEGAGKTTSIQYMESLLKIADVSFILSREPGGTEIAEAIRKLLLSHYQEKMSEDAELLLMFASRAQHLETLIRPALKAGTMVLCDRFTDASYAYQGGGRGIDVGRIKMLEDWVQGALQPDLTILLDLPVEVGFLRASNRSHADRIESEAMHFFEKVRQAYLDRAKQFSNRYRVIDVNVPVEEVQQQLKQLFETEVLPQVSIHE
ncbi:MAG: dTMP kinase [Pseudomonadota bacterium]|nr:dTMP kinase [Gammaproteobacteria bacterium]MBU1558255.1 dTMP kinase [Gammaproteobacteria bacterium]MBU1629282.1 dTMP kinase [Gammaproteobacteria bacterium]MBU1926552.1 dTMP kinase [Gammaproteobacteria bacterium]MBU2546312.1 dTMP kinase [Gammaproteobacteria bacterium]